MKGLNGSYRISSGEVVTFEQLSGATVQVTRCGATNDSPNVVGVIHITRAEAPQRLVCDCSKVDPSSQIPTVEHCLRITRLQGLSIADIVALGSDESVASIPLPFSVVGPNIYRYEVPHTTPQSTVLFAPTVPVKVLNGQICIRTARNDDRKQWNQLILMSSLHNMGGSEMLSVTWSAALKLVAVNDAGTIVGLVCMSSEGWIPYITSEGAPHSGLGSFLLFVAMEWFRLTLGHTVGLSPSDEAVGAWYAGWGFELLATTTRVPITDQIMRRHVDLYVPLLPASIYQYVPDLQLTETARRPITCVICAGQLSESTCDSQQGRTAPESITKVPRYATMRQLLKHIERVHLSDGNLSILHRKALCTLFASCISVDVCGECGIGFDAHECGECDRCWYSHRSKRKRPDQESNH